MHTKKACRRFSNGIGRIDLVPAGRKLLQPLEREGDRLRFQPCHYIGQDYAEYPTSLVSLPPQHGRAIGLNATFVELPIESNMTMEIHPNLRPPGLGFSCVGDIYVSTPTGGERLSKYPSDLQVLEPV